METAPGSTGMLDRGPNHSLGTSKEGYVKPTRICSVIDCGLPIVARGLCSKHYQQLRKSSEWAPLPSREEVFWTRVDKNGPVPAGTPARGKCWIWTALQDGNGYGAFSCNGKKVKAYAFAYCLENEKPPKGWHIDHICHEPLCVRPSHLRVVTHQQNIQNRSNPPTNNRSGYRGVSWSKHANKWRASIESGGKAYNLGYFNTAESANKAAIAARNKLHTHNDLDRIKQGA